MLRVFAERRDHGAVAVIVAISAVALLAFAALAVDLGNAWARKRAIQTTADLAALAGAGGLPDVQAARVLAVKYLENNREPIGSANYLCPLSPGSCWDNDGNYDNGEIDFYGADTNSDGRYTSSGPDERTNGATAVAIRVVPPSGRVDFGFGGAVGLSSMTVTEPATAQLGSALGLGVPPFYLTPSDGGLECIKDGTSGPSPSRVPGWALRASHSITGISPTSGAVGSSVTVTGVGLPTGNGDKATIGGVNANVTARSATSWTLVVPSLAAGTYDIVIPDGNGPAKHDATFPGFTVTAAPAGITLTSLSPSSGQVGSVVTINGSNLPTGGGSTARFGGQTATVDSRSSTQWTVRVPTLPTGAVNVVVSQGSNASNALTYTVTAAPLPPAPVLTDLDPNSGPKGSTVTITGTNLPATGGVVRFGSTAATITARSATSLEVTVPDLTPGPYDVVVNNGSDSNALVFTVTDPACDAVSSNRGYISAPREDDNGNVVDVNIREGLDHNLHIWMQWPLAGAPRAAPAQGAECTDAAPDVHPYPSGPAWLGDVNCLELRTGNIGGELKKGFFNSGSADDGRLYQLCGGPTIASGRGAGADNNRLWQSRFIDETPYGSIATLRSRIENGVAAASDGSERGWITDEVFECPRFAILPVLNAKDDPDNGTGHYLRIIGFQAVWFDDDTADHGFVWQGGSSLQRVRAYVFDIDYLPEEVSAEVAGVVGPYVEGLPKVIQLVHDESDPAT